MEEDMYLPIAAEAEAASRAIAELPAGKQAPEDDDARVEAPDRQENLPALVQSSGEVEPHQERGTPFIPSIPDATKAAARWIRPLVPPFVARVIDNTTQPLRTARQVFEEVEEITFSLKRTRKVTFDSETSATGDRPPHQSAAGETPRPTGRIQASREDRGHGTYHPGHSHVGRHRQHPSLRQATPKDAGGLSLESAERDGTPELTQRDGPRELRSPEGPRELPPGQ